MVKINVAVSPAYRETPECTFMEVYDVKWVTNFDEKMAELNGNNVRKKGEYKRYILPACNVRL